VVFSPRANRSPAAAGCAPGPAAGGASGLHPARTSSTRPNVTIKKRHGARSTPPTRIQPLYPVRNPRLNSTNDFAGTLTQRQSPTSIPRHKRLLHTVTLGKLGAGNRHPLLHRCELPSAE
jgi:hypothetical protein